jgi:hypothetical protein
VLRGTRYRAHQPDIRSAIDEPVPAAGDLCTEFLGKREERRIHGVAGGTENAN